MMVTGGEVTEEDTAPVCVGVDEIECISILGLWSQQQKEQSQMCIGELPRLRSTLQGLRQHSRRVFSLFCSTGLSAGPN